MYTVVSFHNNRTLPGIAAREPSKRREFYVLIGFLRSRLLRAARGAVWFSLQRLLSSQAYLWILGNRYEWTTCEWGKRRVTLKTLP